MPYAATACSKQEEKNKADKSFLCQQFLATRIKIITLGSLLGITIVKLQDNGNREVAAAMAITHSQSFQQNRLR